SLDHVGVLAGNAEDCRTAYRALLDASGTPVADAPAGHLTMVRVGGGDDIDVHLLLGEESRPPAALLPAAARVLSGRHPATPAGALPEGAPGPGLTITVTDSPVPGDHLLTTLPRFTVRAGHDLLALPEVFGLAAGAEGFPGISPAPLAVSQARQDAMATFQATGFEAAAATAVLAAPAGAPPPPGVTHRVRQARVTFDRPFGFLNVHRPTGLILTAGWIAAPGP
ncbi:serpin family protein, partial [Actinomadura kijaniata]|uniref:serpin family protein n=1 Tax=Actinomadura kijaniata TaxID=46161 RepID=UPI003F1981DB